MTPNELHQLICSMESKGGSFISALAQALRYADPTNRVRLINAFPDVVEKYGPNGMFAVAEQMAKELVAQNK